MTTPAMPELPEPELGYIETDKSRQPAFSARQMRAAMQAQPAEVSDAEINRLACLAGFSPVLVATDNGAFGRFARAILALRPQAVPMTDEPQATPIPCAVHVCGKTFEKGVPFCDVIDHVYTNTRRQTPITEDQAWSSDEIMSANALAGLLMSDFMKLIRAVEAHHGITAPAGGEKQA